MTVTISVFQNVNHVERKLRQITAISTLSIQRAELNIPKYITKLLQNNLSTNFTPNPVLGLTPN